MKKYLILTFLFMIGMSTRSFSEIEDDVCKVTYQETLPGLGNGYEWVMNSTTRCTVAHVINDCIVRIYGCPKNDLGSNGPNVIDCIWTNESGEIGIKVKIGSIQFNNPILNLSETQDGIGFQFGPSTILTIEGSVLHPEYNGTSINLDGYTVGMDGYVTIIL